MNDALGRIEKLEEEVAKLKQQATEPMRVVLEQRPTEGETKLLETLLRQSGQQATDIGSLKQSMLRLERKMDESFRDVQKRFEAIAEVQNLILERLPEKGE